jgi:chorismate mutase / prephenate dehydratase
MMRLEELRIETDAIDTEIMALLNKRVTLAVEIGNIKANAGMPVVDVGNAIRILNRVSKMNEGLMRADTVESIFRPILEESRRIQREACERLALVEEDVSQ